MLTPGKPRNTAPLFPPLARRLVSLLRSLTPAQWAAPTCYPNWKVKDIAAHLLQTGLNRLSRQRDGLERPSAAPEPAAPAFYPVAWAGETESQNWFDIGREYTERWHHQEQIREAVGAPKLTRRRFLGPVIAVLIRAVPWWHRKAGAPDVTMIGITVTGPAGARFALRREAPDAQCPA